MTVFTEDEAKANHSYGPTLQRLSVQAKIEIYQSIFHAENTKNITDEMLNLGTAIVCDPEFQAWLDRKVKS